MTNWPSPGTTGCFAHRLRDGLALNRPVLMNPFEPYHNGGQQALETHGFPGGGVFYASKTAADGSAVAPVKRETLYLGSLDKIIDRLQELFDQWERQEIFPASIHTEALDRARLAAHEWIANLVQNAYFKERVPQIALSVWVEGSMLCCLIADNSIGFPLDAYPSESLDDDYDVMPEHGMCWLLIQACTHHRVYRPLGNQGYGLEFVVS